MLSYLLDLLLVIPSILVVMVLVFGLGSGSGDDDRGDHGGVGTLIARQYTRSPRTSRGRIALCDGGAPSGDSAAKTAVREVLPNLAFPWQPRWA